MNNHLLQFNLVVSEHCCGILELGHFEQGGDSTWNGKPIEGLPSLEAVFIQFEDRFLRQCKELTKYSDAWDDKSKYRVTASLVKTHNYGSHREEGEFKELGEWMLKNGWKKDDKFTNPNTGNVVETFKRYITAQDLGIKIGDNGEF